ncbi:mechanosensitive ion channel family protein [Halocynthiibacter sp. C4]|uniref:mechanosensitive ion channel family protein n=1 Tax=Halocynthiibacter sp. C4 TaxID=2992758 RepID=UPI00237A973C|nr:mechanosensitive ion channel family protein [Halocynthiibacter sp. C4]MDE0590083.1 mechanosensitive ion channel family protein [Halocynthiibacter sp. C4]
MRLLSLTKTLLLSFFLAFSLFMPALAQEGEGDDAESAKIEAAVAEIKAADHRQMKFLLLPYTAAELSSAADIWQGVLKQDLVVVSGTNSKLEVASGKEADALRAELETQTSAMADTLEKYQDILSSWEDKGGNPDEIKVHEDYMSAVSLATLRTTDLQSLLRGAGDWLIALDGGLKILLIIVAGIVAFWILRFVARFVRNLVNRKMNLVPNVSRLLRNFIGTIVYWAVVVIGVMVVLGFMGVNVTPLFAVLGGLSFIVAFALQDTLSNFASGLMIMLLKPFDTGDYIITAGIEGTVDDMSIVSTRLRTVDNKVVVVPNSKIWGDVITNVTASNTRRVDMVFGIGYSDDAQQAIDELTKLVEAHPATLKDPAPEIFVGELGDSSVNIFCRTWTKTDDYWAFHWDMMGQAKEKFDEKGISIPFPQRDVHIISE